MKPIFNEEKMSVILELEQIPQIPTYILNYAKTHELITKSEIHLTLINFSQGKNIVDRLKELGVSLEQKQKIIYHVKNLLSNTKWSYEHTEKYYHIKKQYVFPNKTVSKESIVELVDSQAVSRFLAYINELLGTNLVPFPHLTLLSKSSDSVEKNPGIGISSEKEFLSLNPIEIEK